MNTFRYRLAVGAAPLLLLGVACFAVAQVVFAPAVNPWVGRPVAAVPVVNPWTGHVAMAPVVAQPPVVVQPVPVALNPWTRSPRRGTYVVNPWTGRVSASGVATNPWTGRRNVVVNPRRGWW
jgi:hypothetical protein